MTPQWTDAGLARLLAALLKAEKESKESKQ